MNPESAPDNAERTPDGRYIVVGGRRWRASDPAIPANLRAELVNELMAARREIGAGDETARSRVHAAKVALGERGAPWWEENSAEDLRTRMIAAFDALLMHRPNGTVCPSEVARIVGGEGWRGLSDRVRALAWELAEDGRVEVLQKGRPVDRQAKGPIRVGHRAVGDEG